MASHYEMLSADMLRVGGRSWAHSATKCESTRHEHVATLWLKQIMCQNIANINRAYAAGEVDEHVASHKRATSQPTEIYADDSDEWMEERTSETKQDETG